MSDYTFVWKNGWWLKITKIAQLFDYWDKTDQHWYKALENLSDSVEFSPTGKHHADILAYTIGLYGDHNNLSMIHAVTQFAGKIKGQQLTYLLEKGILYINSKGGYHFPYEGQTPETQFCHRKELIFPEFKENDIRIKSFPGGQHYYAYIGDVQIHNGDILKWDTYKEAYERAHKLVQ